MTYKLLTKPTANLKVAKNIAKGVLTAPLHLAPHRLSGFNVCPMATAGCIKSCLHTAGNPAYLAGKNAARIKRTRFFFDHRTEFMAQLVKDIERLNRTAMRDGLLAGVRLNATSDVCWEHVPCVRDGITYRSLMLAFPATNFYDYTKYSNRRNLPANYHLTFSVAENNHVQALAAYDAGFNLAAVLAVKPSQDMPQFIKLLDRELPVIDGDEHDYRPIDPRGVVVGLRAKGQAKNDVSGFVIRDLY